MPSQAILTEYLEGEIAAGRLALRAPAIASSQFFMMIFGELMIPVASGNLTHPDPDVAREEARAAADPFLHAALPPCTFRCATPPGPARPRPRPHHPPPSHHHQL